MTLPLYTQPPQENTVTDFSALCAELIHAVQSHLFGEVSEPELISLALNREPWATWLQPGGSLESAHCELSDLLRTAIALDRSRRAPVQAADALAARPLLEQVARMGDRIGQHTVGEIMAISDRAASWLRENPPGQPVAIEPRGCPIPGACSCVEPAPPAEGEVTNEELDQELVKWLKGHAVHADQAMGSPIDAARFTRVLDLLQRQQPVAVPVSERPWERLGWCDERGRCWAWAHEVNCWQLLMNPIICADFVLLLPAHALPLPAGEVQP